MKAPASEGPYSHKRILIGIYSDIRSGILSDVLSGILSGILSTFFWGPQCSESRRVRSGEAQRSPVEVGPLRSRAGRWGPARKRRRKEGRGGGRQADIKSNNPHLAGGEKHQSSFPGNTNLIVTVKVGILWSHPQHGSDPFPYHPQRCRKETLNPYLKNMLRKKKKSMWTQRTYD